MMKHDKRTISRSSYLYTLHFLHKGIADFSQPKFHGFLEFSGFTLKAEHLCYMNIYYVPPVITLGPWNDCKEITTIQTRFKTYQFELMALGLINV